LKFGKFLPEHSKEIVFSENPKLLKPSTVDGVRQNVYACDVSLSCQANDDKLIINLRTVEDVLKFMSGKSDAYARIAFL
jgi:hypothetical protein